MEISQLRSGWIVGGRRLRPGRDDENRAVIHRPIRDVIICVRRPATLWLANFRLFLSELNPRRIHRRFGMGETILAPVPQWGIQGQGCSRLTWRVTRRKTWINSGRHSSKTEFLAMKWIIWILLVATVAGGIYMSKRSRTEKLTAHKAKTEAAKNDQAKNVANLAIKNSADAEWESRIPERGAIGYPFTVDVEAALIPSNNVPVLVETELIDIARHGDGYVARFSEFSSTKAFFQLHLELDCTSEQVAELLSAKDGALSRFAVIARIRRVFRPTFQLTGEGIHEEYGVQIETNPDTFIAKGECVEFLPVKDSFSLEEAVTK